MLSVPPDTKSDRSMNDREPWHRAIHTISTFLKERLPFSQGIADFQKGDPADYWCRFIEYPANELNRVTLTDVYGNVRIVPGDDESIRIEVSGSDAYYQERNLSVALRRSRLKHHIVVRENGCPSEYSKTDVGIEPEIKIHVPRVTAVHMHHCQDVTIDGVGGYVDSFIGLNERLTVSGFRGTYLTAFGNASVSLKDRVTGGENAEVGETWIRAYDKSVVKMKGFLGETTVDIAGATLEIPAGRVQSIEGSVYNGGRLTVDAVVHGPCRVKASSDSEVWIEGKRLPEPRPARKSELTLNMW